MAGPVRDAVELEAAEAMRDNPKEIADQLVEEHGLEVAIATVTEGNRRFLFFPFGTKHIAGIFGN